MVLQEPFKRPILGLSLVVQWLRLRSSTVGSEFDPWLRNYDPTCHEVWPNQDWEKSPIPSVHKDTQIPTILSTFSKPLLSTWLSEKTSDHTALL